MCWCLGVGVKEKGAVCVREENISGIYLNDFVTVIGKVVACVLEGGGDGRVEGDEEMMKKT